MTGSSPSSEAVATAVRQAVAAGWRPLADSRGYCSSVARIECEGRPLVVKAPAEQKLGFLWRFLLRREHRAYERLAGVEGVPRCYGLVDGRYLVLEHVEARGFREAAADVDAAFFDRLFELVERLHARGVAHGDLKKKENLLVTADGRPVAIDFATATVRREGFAPFNHLLYRTLERFDYHAWLKHKYRRDYRRMTPEDARYHRRTPFEAFNHLLVHRLRPRSRPRYRQTLAGRSQGEAPSGRPRRWREGWRQRRAWRAAMAAAPLRADEPCWLQTVEGAPVACLDGALAGRDGESPLSLRVRPGDRSEIVRYGARVTVGDASGRTVRRRTDDGRLVVDAAAGDPALSEYVVFDPTSRCQEGEPVRPDLPVSLATPDQKLRWLYEVDRGGGLVASPRYLRRWSTFFFRRPEPSAG